MKRLTCLIGATMLLAFLTASPISSQMKLPPGVKVQVVKQFSPSFYPGAKSVTQILFTLEPGAKLENFSPPGLHICNGLAGEAKVTFKDGTTVIRKAGTMWLEKKGVPWTIVNEGKVTFVDSFLQIVY